MADPTANTMLRPLGFGEIFDRAVTLYVRNFAPFSLILLVLVVPNAIAQYAFQSQQLGQLASALKGVAPADPFAAYETPAFAWALVFGLLFLIALPFALNAIALGVARIYAGGSIDVKACYTQALRKFWPTLGLLLMDLLILGGTYMVLAIVGGIGIGIGVAIGSLGTFFAIVVFVVTAIVVLAVLALMVVMAIGLSFAMFALIIEDEPVFDAIGDGFRRVFARSEIGRAALFALAMFALALLQLIVTYATMGLAYYLHQSWLLTLETVVVSTAFNAFMVILLAVYYYDVRVRHEGLDLEAQLASLTATSA